MGTVSDITDHSWDKFDSDYEGDFDDLTFEFNSDEFHFKGDLDAFTDEFADDLAKDVTVYAVDTISAWFYIAGIVSIIGGILGIIGGIIVRKKNVTAGVLLIIAAVASCLTIIGFVSAILLVLAAVFAFIPEKPSSPPIPA